jgi:hypothetical protein
VSEESLVGLVPARILLPRDRGLGPQKLPTASEVLSSAGGEDAVVADPDEARREDVLEEKAGEFCSAEGAESGRVSVRAVLVAEGDVLPVVVCDPGVRDRDAVDVSGEVRVSPRSFSASGRVSVVWSTSSSLSRACDLEEAMPDAGRCGGRLRPGRNFRRVAALVQQGIGPVGRAPGHHAAPARRSIPVLGVNP